MPRSNLKRTSSKLPVEQLEFNLPQLLTVLAPQPEKWLEWGRGTGKSTQIGWQIKEVVHQMPRSSGVIIGSTFRQILENTIPSTIAALERLGWYKDIHYFIGTRPPKKLRWPEPFEPPVSYQHYMAWYTGAGFHLSSQDRSGSGRGLNTDYVIGDEAALLDPERLQAEILATNRGNLQRFGKCSLHHGTLFASTIPTTQRGRYMYKMEDEAIAHPDKIFYLRASAEENIHNLGADWFKKMKRTMPDFLYNAEILNIRPSQVDEGFYPHLKEDRHMYINFDYGYYDNLGYQVSRENMDCRGDGDVDPDEPLELSCDWGARINCLVVAQEHGSELRLLNDMFVKHPKILDDVFEDFCHYYRHHRCRMIYFWYDRNGNSRMANSQYTFAEQAETILRKHGWEVQKMTQGLDPPHQEKYLLWSRLLEEKDNSLPRIRINQHNCANLITSMQMAPVREGRDGLKKDKRSEQKTNIPAEEATHFSDAADVMVFGKYRRLLDGPSEFFEVVFS